MDRLGDDLTELILQYLTFKDKVCLECVSKQWRRLVFNKQFVIEIDNEDSKNSIKRILDERYELNEQYWESVLKKCPNIIKVDLCVTVNNSVLSLIGRYCPNIKSLTYPTEFDNALDFFRIYGHKLEELKIVYVRDDKDEDENKSRDIKPILELCPNLKNIDFEDFSVLFTNDKKFLPELDTHYIGIRNIS